MKATGCSKMLLPMYQTLWHCIPGDSNLYPTLHLLIKHCCFVKRNSQNWHPFHTGMVESTFSGLQVTASIHNIFQKLIIPGAKMLHHVIYL
jgi:hypothetical protein